MGEGNIMFIMVGNPLLPSPMLGEGLGMRADKAKCNSSDTDFEALPRSSLRGQSLKTKTAKGLAKSVKGAKKGVMKGAVFETGP
jgi:hypothetical protein